MTIHNFKPFKVPEANQPGRRGIQTLNATLKELRIVGSEEDIGRGELGDATKEAIEELQRRTKLRAHGVVRPKTVAGLQSEMAHLLFTRSKPGAGDVRLPIRLAAARWLSIHRGGTQP